jgi:hypothetical protein
MFTIFSLTVIVFKNILHKNSVHQECYVIGFEKVGKERAVSLPLQEKQWRGPYRSHSNSGNNCIPFNLRNS